jgi:transcription termination factor NusB
MSTTEEDCTKLIPQDTDAGKRLHNLKRRRARERSNITRFVTEVENFTDITTLEDYEYFKDRLHETLGRITSLDDQIHELLDDSEYNADLQRCEEYIESAKRAILRTSRQIERHLAASTANVTITNSGESAATVAPIASSAAIRLPPIKLEPFCGDIETWARFWEQFKHSIDSDPLLKKSIKTYSCGAWSNVSP